MANRIQLRRDTQANWERVNPILEDGEPGLDITQNKIKYGDGTSTWTELAYASGGSSALGNTLVNGSYTLSLGADGNVTLPLSGIIGTGTSSYIQIPADGFDTGQPLTILNNVGNKILLVANNNNWQFTEDGATTLPTVLAGDTSIGTAFNTNPPGHTLTLKHNGGVNGGSGGELKFDYGNAKIKVVKDAGITYTWAFNSNGITTLPSGVELIAGYPGYGYIANTAALAGDQVYLSSFDGNSWVGVENGQPSIGTAGGFWAFGIDGSTSIPGNVTIGTGWGNISMVDTIFANNYAYANGVSILAGLGGSATGNVANLVNGSETVSLSADGKLTLPNGNFFQSQSGQGETNIQIVDTESSFKIYTSASNGAQAWVFAADGTTSFPDHANVSMTGTLTVGNLVVNGNSVIINTQSYSVEDNIIQIAAGNPADTLDIGFVGHRTVNTVLQHTGLVRNAGLNQWALFSNVVAQPGTTVDFSNAIYDDLRLGNITSPTIDLLNSNITQANIGMKGYVDSQTFYSNVQVATYLRYGNIANISVAGNVTATNVTATLFRGNGALLTGITPSVSSLDDTQQLPILVYKSAAGQLVTASGNAGSIPSYQPHTGGMNAWTFSAQSTTGNGVTSQSSISATGNIYAIGNVIAGGNVNATYFVGNGAFLTGIVASGSYSNVQVATYLPTYTGNIANVRLGVSGVLTFPDGTTQTTAAAAGGGSSYGNANVAQYLPTHTGNVGVNSLIGTTPNVTLVSGSYSTTYDIYGNVAFGNAAYPVQISAAGNISTGGYLFGNGAFLTGIVTSGGGGSSYGNANVAQYLPTYTGNIANIRLGTSGVLTFADGTTQTTAGGGSYSNVQVATYLPTYTGNISGSYFNGNVVGTQYGNMVLSAVQQITSVPGTNANVTVNPDGTGWFTVTNITPAYFGNVVTITGNAAATGGGALTVGPAGYTLLPTVVTQFTGNANTYAQLNVQNINSGAASTTEIVATANNGNDTTFFVDLGVAGSNYNVNAPANSLGTTIYPNDSYLYAQGNLATTTGGNLAIGTSTPNKSVKIFAGGINSANIVATVSNTGLAVTGNVSATGNVTVSGYVVTAGGYGNISQVDYITANTAVLGNVFFNGVRSTKVISRNTAKGGGYANIDNISFRLAAGGYAQVSTISSTYDAFWSWRQVFSGNSTSGAYTGATLSTTYSNIGSTGMGSGGDTLEVMFYGQTGTDIYRVTFLQMLSAGNATIIAERVA